MPRKKKAEFARTTYSIQTSEQLGSSYPGQRGMRVGLNPMPGGKAEQLVEAIEHAIWFAPRDLRAIDFEFAGDDTETIAMITACPEYRNSVIRIYSMFFDRPLIDRVRVILHELSHHHIEKVADFGVQLIKQHVEFASRDFIDDRLTERVEEVVEDMAQMFTELVSARAVPVVRLPETRAQLGMEEAPND